MSKMVTGFVLLTVISLVYVIVVLDNNAKTTEASAELDSIQIELLQNAIAAYKNPSTIIYARTICGGEVSISANRPAKLSILQVAERRAKDCETTVGEELLKHMQFSVWNDRGLIVDKTNIHEFSRCLNEAVEIITGPRELWMDNFYHAVAITPSWDMSQMRYSGTIGGHKFYTSLDNSYCTASKPLRTVKPGDVKKRIIKETKKKVPYDKFILDSLKRLKNQTL